MSSSKMAPLLGKPTGGRKRSIFSVVQALVGLVAIGLGAWHAMHYLIVHVPGQPLYVGLYPLIGVGSLVLSFPFLLFLSFPDEFGRALQPLLPADYWFLLQRSIGAAERGNMKVSAKEL